MKLAWVVGAGGMLGSALRRALAGEGTRLFVPHAGFDWEDEHRVAGQFDSAVRDFVDALRPGWTWEIYWAAGIGTLASREEVLGREGQMLARLLARASEHRELAASAGTLVLASSAGGIYAGCSDEIISEASTESPTTAYAHAKLDQERLIADFVAAHAQSRGLIARISTLYGRQPRPDKPQGLIAAMVRGVIRRLPIQVYVPLDTIRDYLAVEDAADALVGLARAPAGAARLSMRIVASEQATTISELIAVLKRVSHRAPRIVTSSGQLTAVYRRRIQFRSNLAGLATVWPKTSLTIGISRLLASERMAFGCAAGA